jgi:SAM-dependent methyltransferase
MLEVMYASVRRLVFVLALVVAGCGKEEAEPHPDQVAWDAMYSESGYFMGKKPVRLLVKNVGLLPKGRALDLAAGEGRNAVFLAQHGFEVDAVDISPVGLRKAEALAAERGVEIETIVANLEEYDLGVERYEVVANFYYLQRDLTPKIKRALKPGGIVIYETFTVRHLEIRGARGPSKREHYLELGELRKMFEDFEILHWSEVRDVGKGIASLIARRPSGGGAGAREGLRSRGSSK